MQVILTEEEYNRLKQHDASLEVKNLIKNRLMRVIKEHKDQLEYMPGGGVFIIELKKAIEES